MRSVTFAVAGLAAALVGLGVLGPLPVAADELATSARDTAKRLLQEAYTRYGSENEAAEATAEVADDKSGLCRFCHGADGNSGKSGLPSLAGERPEYLLQRMIRLDQGDYESKTCSRMMRRTNREQMLAMSLYFSNIRRYPVPFDSDLAAKGKPIYQNLCQKCHLADGGGQPGMPVIGGQQPDYIARTLVNFRDHPGWRHVDEMPPQASQLAPVEISAVAAYAASLSH